MIVDPIRTRYVGELTKYDLENPMWDLAIDGIPILNGGHVMLMDCMGEEIDIVNAARKSFNKISTKFEDTEQRILKKLFKKNHGTPFEMIEFKFHVKCPIFVARQWQRHRTWSYNEISRRYTISNAETYFPNREWISGDHSYNDLRIIRDTIIKSLESSIDNYEELIDIGVKPEQARMVLPQSMYIEMYAKVDLNNLIKFLIQRCDKHAQWEIRQYAYAIVELIRNIVPNTVELIEERVGKYNG